MHLEASSSSNLLPCHQSLPKPKVSSSPLVWGGLQNTSWKGPELGAGLKQDRHCGEAAPATPRLLLLNSRELLLSAKARYCHEAQGTTRSNMPLGEAPSPGLPWGASCRLHLKTEKNPTCHNALPKATHLWTMGPHYNTSVQAIKSIFLSSPFPKLKQDVKVWRLNRQDKEENFNYQGYFPHFQESHLLSCQYLALQVMCILHRPGKGADYACST